MKDKKILHWMASMMIFCALLRQDDVAAMITVEGCSGSLRVMGTRMD